MALHPKIAEVTRRIEERSRDSRRDYLERWGDGELRPTYDSAAAPAA